ncbi:hypothetical protein AX17_005564 [Amanita inopinata Kibby_2008]|nr:hypothetical protein AX17_005564 [Amanita inopinata Kibby_2008]
MKSIFALLLSATYVAAHGFLAQVTIDGTVYKGNVPNSATNPSVIRQVSDIGPVKGANNPDVNCGMSAKPASLVADAMPGSTVSFDWRGGDNSNWPHTTGPMMTYLASCGSQTCDKFDSTQAKWFLIDEVGKNSDDQWAQLDISKGGVANVKLPSDLAPGNYIARHEIIALHLGNSLGGAEFYPSCTQLRVGGSQTGTPSASDLVSLPGAYKDSDPGIFDPNVFNPGDNYVFPGPHVASFITGGGSSTNSNSNSNSGNSSQNTPTGTASPSQSASPSTTQTSSPSKQTGTCRLRKSNQSNSTSSTQSRRALQFHRRHNMNRPRTISRIMRNVVLGEKAQ